MYILLGIVYVLTVAHETTFHYNQYKTFEWRYWELQFMPFSHRPSHALSQWPPQWTGQTMLTYHQAHLVCWQPLSSESAA